MLFQEGREEKMDAHEVLRERFQGREHVCAEEGGARSNRRLGARAA
jgi:hypothetical protein